MFTEAFPILSTSDVGRALAFYRDLLGATVTYQFPPEGAPAYVSVQFGKASVGLGHDPDFRRTPGRPPIALWLYTDDLDGLVAAIRSAGGRITQEPADQPWGEREARAEDPDGNQLNLGQRAG